jgi:hypothetical protein
LGQANQTHWTGGFFRENSHLARGNIAASGEQVDPDHDQVRVGSLCALNDELWPEPILVELGTAPNPPVGTPLPLALEELSLAAEPRFDVPQPSSTCGARAIGRRLCATTAAPSIHGDQDDLAIGGPRD